MKDTIKKIVDPLELSTLKGKKTAPIFEIEGYFTTDGDKPTSLSIDFFSQGYTPKIAEEKQETFKEED